MGKALPNPESHESALLDLVRKQGPADLKHLIRQQLRVWGSDLYTYSEEFVRHPVTDQGYATRRIERRVVWSDYPIYMLTEEGEKARDGIMNLIQEGERGLDRWLAGEPEKAREYLARCGGNLLLLKNWNPKKQREFDLALSAEGKASVSRVDVAGALDDDPMWNALALDSLFDLDLLDGGVDLLDPD